MSAARYTANDLAMMRRLREKGFTLRQIAHVFDCSHVYVLFKTRPPTPHPEAQSDARSVTPESQ